MTSLWLQVFVFIIILHVVFFNEFEYHSGNVYPIQYYVIKVCQ